MTDDPAIVTKLDELLTTIRSYDDPRRAADQWKQVYKLLQKAQLPPGRVTAVVGMRNVAGLATMIDQLGSPSPVAITEDIPDAETCKKAFLAFRKRLSLTVLDEESKLGRSPLTKGRDSHASAAIIPPGEWPEPVWKELVRQGNLKYIGHGFYELVKH